MIFIEKKEKLVGLSVLLSCRGLFNPSLYKISLLLRRGTVIVLVNELINDNESGSDKFCVSVAIN